MVKVTMIFLLSSLQNSLGYQWMNPDMKSLVRKILRPGAYVGPLVNLEENDESASNLNGVELIEAKITSENLNPPTDPPPAETLRWPFFTAQPQRKNFISGTPQPWLFTQRTSFFVGFARPPPPFLKGPYPGTNLPGVLLTHSPPQREFSGVFDQRTTTYLPPTPNQKPGTNDPINEEDKYFTPKRLKSIAPPPLDAPTFTQRPSEVLLRTKPEFGRKLTFPTPLPTTKPPITFTLMRFHTKVYAPQEVIS